MKRLIFLIVAATLILFPVLSSAKGGSSSSSSSSGGGRSSSSFSSARSSSSSSSSSPKVSVSASPSTPSKPVTASVTPSSTPSMSGVTVNKSMPSVKIPPVAASASTATKSSFAAAGTSGREKKASFEVYKTEQAKFAPPPTATPPITVRSPSLPTPKKTWSSYNDYSTYRGTYYQQRGWSPPTYTYSTYPSFGGFDNAFLFFMLGNMSSDFFHHRQNDPGVQSFMKEADRLSTDNKDLKVQLDKVKADMEKLKQEGKEIKADYVPEDIEPDVVIAQSMEEPDDGIGWLGGIIIGLFIVVFGSTSWYFYKRLNT